MNKARRIGALLAASVAALGMASVGLASPAAAMERGPKPTSTGLRAVRAHTSTWSSIAWRTNQRICNVQVRVDGGRKVDIDYPGNRRFTSFSHSNSLGAGRTDFTAIRVKANFGGRGVAVLRATIKYDNCGLHARTTSRTSTLNLPVVVGATPGNHASHGTGANGAGTSSGAHGSGSNGSGGTGSGGTGSGSTGSGSTGSGGTGSGGNGQGGAGHSGTGHSGSTPVPASSKSSGSARV
jgi:hypothetical protein